MIDTRWRESFNKSLHPVGAQVSRVGITADQLTAVGLVMAGLASLTIAQGHLRAGLLLVVLTALPDVLDGAVARSSGTASLGGAFADSVCDLVADALLMGGVAWYLSTTHNGPVAVLPLAVVVAIMLVPFERARAEALGFEMQGDLVERVERLLLLGLGLLSTALLVPMLWVMLVLTLYTAVRRFVRVTRDLHA